MRLIDADSLEQKIHAEQESAKSNDDATWERNKRYFRGLAMARRFLLDAPTIDAQPVRHGHWDIGGYIIGDARVSCSECGFVDEQTFPMPFCGRCGAKMDEEEDKNG